ncbi:unnamed protein product [Tetraodon nigroviridis]|uniref:(spotted green pufferfish) hypothetical protein n=1 Tax=Tetraodon nigroviridis TaxID=99883 RepID=Q4RTH1_TETNG|nr:unnamed protein product [Tetraodon nigroviridis]
MLYRRGHRRAAEGPRVIWSVRQLLVSSERQREECFGGQKQSSALKKVVSNRLMNFRIASEQKQEHEEAWSFGRCQLVTQSMPRRTSGASE